MHGPNITMRRYGLMTMPEHILLQVTRQCLPKYMSLSKSRIVQVFSSFRRTKSKQYRAKTILDIGCGTGHLTTRLHNDGCEVYGIDFSQEMLKKAQEKMPHAHLMQYDFTFGLPPAWKNTKFDSIISTYALHHLDNKQKLALIKDLNRQLNKGGVMVLGDIAFETLHDMEMAREQAGEEWDEEEFYFIAEDVFSIS